MIRSAFTLVLASLALAVPAAAQQNTLRGEVDTAIGNRVVLADTDVTLSGNLSALLATEGPVELLGEFVGPMDSPTFSVTSISPGVETFDIAEVPRIGGSSYLEVSGAPGELAFGFLSLGQGVTPLLNGEVLLVDAGQVVVRGSGRIRADGSFEVPFTVPNDPTIVGMQVFGQGVVFRNNGGFELTNPDRATIID